MIELLTVFLVLIGMGLLVQAAFTDWKERRIPNNIVAALALLGIITTILYAPWTGDLIGVALKLINISVFLVVLGILGWFGAVMPGDIKLFFAAALFSAGAEGPVYLFFGLALQLAVLIPVLYVLKKCWLMRHFPMALLFPIPVALSYLILLFH